MINDGKNYDIDAPIPEAIRQEGLAILKRIREAEALGTLSPSSEFLDQQKDLATIGEGIRRSGPMASFSTLCRVLPDLTQQEFTVKMHDTAEQTPFPRDVVFEKDRTLRAYYHADVVPYGVLCVIARQEESEVLEAAKVLRLEFDEPRNLWTLEVSIVKEFGRRATDAAIEYYGVPIDNATLSWCDRRQIECFRKELPTDAHERERQGLDQLLELFNESGESTEANLGG